MKRRPGQGRPLHRQELPQGRGLPVAAWLCPECLVRPVDPPLGMGRAEHAYNNAGVLVRVCVVLLHAEYVALGGHEAQP